MIELIELQSKLLAEDLKATARRVIPPVAMCVASVCIFFTACVALTIAIAELIVHYAQWERGFAYLLVAGVGIVITIMLVSIAVFLLKRSTNLLQRSKEEFFANLRALASSWSRDVRPAESRRAMGEHNGKH